MPLKATLSAALLALVLFTGCNSQENQGDPSANEAPGTNEKPGTNEEPGGHAHPTEGPHHGSLVELGNEEYHAELLHDEQAGTVTIYILDSAAKKTVPIDATQVTVNLKHEGQPKQFQLPAKADDDDPEGKSSRFVSEDAELAAGLDAEGADARLVVKIAGKSYNGALAHDHGDHDH